MRIAIAEDLRLLRDAMVRTCARECGHRVVAETNSGLEVLALVAALRPDALLLDLAVADIDAFAVIERLRASAVPTKIIALAAASDAYTVFRIERAGIQGFIAKQDITVCEFKSALRTIEAGGTYFSASFETARRARHTDPRSFDKILSETEQKVLRLIGEGLTNDEIGTTLGISPRTVQTHRQHILRKLGINSTPKLIAFAMRHGFTPHHLPPRAFQPEVERSGG